MCFQSLLETYYPSWDVLGPARTHISTTALYTFSVSNFPFLLSAAPHHHLFNLTRENDMLISAPPLLGHLRVSRLETSAEERRQCIPTAGQADPTINQADGSIWTMTVICQEAGGGVSLTHRSPALSYTSLIIISIIHLQGVAFFFPAPWNNRLSVFSLPPPGVHNI